MKDWNPALYLRFADQRTRPAQELVARIAHPNTHTVSDLGCGPGPHSHSKRNKTVEAYATSKCVKNTSLGER